MSEQRQLLKNTKIMALMTGVSRVFGLLRDQLVAFLLGATRLGDVWSVSFMLPNLFRRLIAEGAMSTAFVPLLAESREHMHERDTEDFIRSMLSMVLVATTLLVTAFVLALPWALPFLLEILRPAAGGSGVTDYNPFILPTQIMFPYLIFISLAALCQAVLNVNNRFALAAVTPVVLNIFIIVFGFWLRDWRENPIWGLCIGVLLGGFFQFFLQAYHLHRLGFNLMPKFPFWRGRTRKAVRLWLPTTFSAGIVQINAFVSTSMAVSLVEGGAITLATSNRLIELILGIFTASLTTSLLPLLANQRHRKDGAALETSLWTGLSVMTLIGLPAAFGLILAGPSIIGFLFMRGAFDMRSMVMTYTALIFHAMALLPISWYRILNQTFYAYKQVRVTVVIAAIAAAVNILGCFLLPTFFYGELNHCGIALATLLSSWVLFGLSLQKLMAGLAVSWPSWFTIDLVKITLACAAMIPIWLPFQAGPLPLGTWILKMFASIMAYFVLVRYLGVSSFKLLTRRN